MDSLNLIALIVIGFLTGLIIGGAIMYWGIRPRSRRQLESELDRCNQQLGQYKSQITEHFALTAALVDNLDLSYRELQNHLTASAELLGASEAPMALLIDNPTKYSKTSTLIPPLDYAPKKGKLGTLNEGYGLKDDLQSKQPPSGEAYSDLS